MVACPFKANYIRKDPYDENSPFILDMMNCVHNHELQYEIAAPFLKHRYRDWTDIENNNKYENIKVVFSDLLGILINET